MYTRSLPCPSTYVYRAEPFIGPPDPSRLQVPECFTQYQIVQARDQSARVFGEVIGIERVIIQQVVVTMESKFLQVLQTLGANKLNQPFPQILIYLLTTKYDDVIPSDLCEPTSQVENLTFPPSEPVHRYKIYRDR